MSLGKYERFISPHHRHIHNAAAAAGEEEGSGKKGEFDLPCMRPLFGRFGSLSSRLPACPPVCVCEKSGQVWVCLCEKKGINHGSNGGWRIWVFFADAASWPQSEWETRARARSSRNDLSRAREKHNRQPAEATVPRERFSNFEFSTASGPGENHTTAAVHRGKKCWRRKYWDERERAREKQDDYWNVSKSRFYYDVIAGALLLFLQCSAGKYVEEEAHVGCGKKERERKR